MTSDAKMPSIKPSPRFAALEGQARVTAAIRTGTPFAERLTSFWANHFCVSTSRPFVNRIAGAYEREAIRPYVLGRFRSMLGAVAHHPAMLSYLDNVSSVGPHSAIGQKRKKGLNENLGREMLELHTLGADGGYTQEDVTNLAKALTGWTFHKDHSEKAGTFDFEEQLHEPGAVTIMGKRYAQEGPEQAEAIMDDLARHPATANHMARKLARHFVSESPPPALVEELAAVFRRTDGDLRAVSAALASSDAAWKPDPVKVLPPYDFLVSSFRAAQVVPHPRLVERTLSTFGQPLWGVPSPAGWPDEDLAWAAPVAMLERIDWADRAALDMNRRDPTRDVIELMEDVLGPSLSNETRQTVRRAESRRQAMALLLLSPEFQRR